jgi:hypothetical protein
VEPGDGRSRLVPGSDHAAEAPTLQAVARESCSNTGPTE